MKWGSVVGGVPDCVETTVASFHSKEKPAALERAFEKWAD